VHNHPEMLDRVILHIGTHKTGTTAIQGSLGEASDALLSRGVLYPRSGRRGVGHVELARLAEHPGEMPGGREGEQELLEEIRAASPSTLVLSAERPPADFPSAVATWSLERASSEELEFLGELVVEALSALGSSSRPLRDGAVAWHPG